MKELVIFDVDETIVDGQSQRLFLGYLRSKGEIGVFTYIKILTWFIFYKIGLAKDPRAIMEYAFGFMKGKPREEISALAHDFFETRLKEAIYPEAIKIIADHIQSGKKVILLSNAADIVVREVANYLKVTEYLSTELELDGGIYTGRLAGLPRYGSEKLAAIKKYVERNNMDIKMAWAYADHGSDITLLEQVGHPIAVNAAPALSKVAHERNWPTLEFVAK